MPETIVLNCDFFVREQDVYFPAAYFRAVQSCRKWDLKLAENSLFGFGRLRRAAFAAIPLVCCAINHRRLPLVALTAEPPNSIVTSRHNVQ